MVVAFGMAPAAKKNVIGAEDPGDCQRESVRLRGIAASLELRVFFGFEFPRFPVSSCRFPVSGLLVFAFLSDFRSCGLPVSYEFLTATLMECYHRQAGNGQPETSLWDSSEFVTGVSITPRCIHPCSPLCGANTGKPETGKPETCGFPLLAFSLEL
jgi:hypothetical protein